MKYQCSFCAKIKGSGWRCSDCGILLCNDCSKGGRSGAVGMAGRILAGVATYGASEVARAGYRKVRQKCVSCHGTNLIRL